jgi:hypothetical protein
MVCAHIRYTRASIWKICIFLRFFIFCLADNFVADFPHCAWCPHILIGVLGGYLLPGDPPRKILGVPDPPSRIYGLPKSDEKQNFQHILGTPKMRLINEKSIIKSKNSMFWRHVRYFWYIFFVFEHKYICFWCRKKFGNTATLQPPKSSTISCETPFFHSKWYLSHISIVKGAPLKLWQHFGNICLSVTKT